MFAQTKRPRVFCCVDDKGETCEQLIRMLNEAGGVACDVISAREAASALWWARNERFDLYIIGHEFPDGSGLELCRQLREFDKRTPVIFYAEDAGDSARRLEGLAADAQAYLVRLDVEELAVMVLRLLDGEGRAAA